MALLEAVVFPHDHRRPPCCLSCGTACCVLCGHGVAGDLEGVKSGAVVQQDGEELVSATPHARNASRAWLVANVVGAATTWDGPAAPSSEQRPLHDALVRPRRRRRRRPALKEARSVEDDAESQRLNHIAVERNRRRRMNEYLAELRALMPRSYARRGAQASIVGGAIDFVKELEHHLQSLHAENGEKRRCHAAAVGHRTESFASFFTFPQYSVSAAADIDEASGTRPGVADVEAAVSDGHATVKVLAPRRRPGQQLLLRLLLGLQRHGLAALHLNVTTTSGQMVFYTITLRMGDGCQLSSAGDVAAAVHDIVAEAIKDGGRESVGRGCQVKEIFSSTTVLG